MDAILSKSPHLSDLKSHLHSTHTSPKLSDLAEHFHHSHHGSPDLSHVTAVTLPPVEEYKIALIGDTGSGKSSLMLCVSSLSNNLPPASAMKLTLRSLSTISLKNTKNGTPRFPTSKARKLISTGHLAKSPS
jgi:ABC-type histidine transport system ATPase subunit